MRPEQVPELTAYPHVREFVRQHLAMQFGDVRGMLRLPLRREGIENGCNFAAASCLCNLISGISVVLFNRRGRQPGARPRDRRQRFHRLLSAAYYPWQPGEDPGKKSTVLYQIVRNPVSHCLAVLEPGDMPLSCLKTYEGMSQEEVDALDVAYDSGSTLPKALERRMACGTCTCHFSMRLYSKCFDGWYAMPSRCSRRRRALRGAN